MELSKIRHHQAELETALNAMYKAPTSCSSVSWSPFTATKLLVASSQYYGIVGNGLCLPLVVEETSVGRWVN